MRNDRSILPWRFGLAAPTAFAPLSCWLLVLLFLAPTVWAQAETEGAKPEVEKQITEVKPAQLELKPGNPLSVESLVVYPAELKGALSWTLETRRHRGELVAMAVTNDATLAATGGGDGTIRIWELATGKLVRALVGHSSALDCLSWSPDGRTLASTAAYDATLRLWDAQTGMPLRQFDDFKEYTQQVAWSPVGGRLAVAGGRSGWVWVWDETSKQGRVVIEIGKPILSIDWSPSGEQLALATIEGPAVVADVASGKVVHTFGEASALHYAACWSPDGTRLIVTGQQKSIVYKIPEAKALATLPKAGWMPAWSPDSKSLYLLTPDGALLWDLEVDKIVERLDSGGWLQLAWKQPKRLVAIRAAAMLVWEPRAGKASAKYHYISAVPPPLWAEGRPVITGFRSKQLRSWDAKTAEPLCTFKGHTGGVTDAAWSPDGKLLASTGYDNTVRLWEPETGNLRATLAEHKALVLCLAWSPDGKTLATAGHDKAVRLWDAKGKLQATLTGHTKPVKALAWSLRGDRLASGGEDSSVRVWDPHKSQLEREIRVSEELESLAFHPNGTILAGGATDELVRLWLVSSGKPVMKDLRGTPGTPPAAVSINWSPDGRFLVVGRRMFLVQLWEWRSGKLSNWYYTAGKILSVGFLSDGRYLFAGSEDRSVRFWDRVTGAPLGHVVDQSDHVILLNARGDYRVTAKRQPDIVYVVQTATEQLTLKPAEFVARFGWKNDPEKVSLPGK